MTCTCHTAPTTPTSLNPHQMLATDNFTLSACFLHVGQYHPTDNMIALQCSCSSDGMQLSVEDMFNVLGGRSSWVENESKGQTIVKSSSALACEERVTIVPALSLYQFQVDQRECFSSAIVGKQSLKEFVGVTWILCKLIGIKGSNLLDSKNTPNTSLPRRNPRHACNKPCKAQNNAGRQCTTVTASFNTCSNSCWLLHVTNTCTHTQTLEAMSSTFSTPMFDSEPQIHVHAQSLIR